MQRFHPVRRLGGGERAELTLAIERGPLGVARPVVLKRPHIEGRGDPAVLSAFAREAVAYCRVEHPAVVKLYEFVDEGRGSVCLVLEYVDGISLAQLLDELRARGRERALDDEGALFVASRIFAALAAAHAACDPVSGEFAPVLHRDINPSNVLLPWNGFAKVADFAFAKVTGTSADATRTGLLKGTYGYMAPEQVLGEPCSTRTDVYAGCLVLRELLCGKPAFPRDRLPELEILAAMAAPKLEPLGALRPDLPRALCEAVDRGLAADPEERSISAAQLLAKIREHSKVDWGRARLQAMLIPFRSGVSESDAPGAEIPTIVRTLPTPPSLPSRPESPVRVAAWRPSADETLRLTASHAEPACLAAERTPLAAPTQPAEAWPLADTIESEPPRGARDSLDAATVLTRFPHRYPSPALIFVASAAAVVLVLAATVAMRSAHRSAASPVTLTTSHAEVTSSLAAASEPIAPPPPASTGHVAIDAPAHVRVWLDGKLLGEGSQRLAVPCGPHDVRVGRAARTRSLDVPCGGELYVNTTW